MLENYQIDSLDRKILSALQQNARLPYLELARKLIVSGGTIHQRIEKMKEMGIITGSKMTVDPKKLGQDVTVLIGLNLKTAKNLDVVIKQLKMFKEVTQAYYTTGSYGLIIKAVTKNVQSFHQFLVEKLQNIDEIQSTESFLCLDVPIDREIDLGSG